MTRHLAVGAVSVVAALAMTPLTAAPAHADPDWIGDVPGDVPGDLPGEVAVLGLGIAPILEAVFYDPIYLLGQLYLHSPFADPTNPLGIVNQLLNLPSALLLGRDMVANGFDAPDLGNPGGDAGWLFGDGGSGGAGVFYNGEYFVGAGGAGGLLGNGGAGGAGAPGEAGGAGGAGGLLFGDGGIGGNGGAGGADGVGGTGGDGGRGGVLIGDGGAGGNGGAGGAGDGNSGEGGAGGLIGTPGAGAPASQPPRERP